MAKKKNSFLVGVLGAMVALLVLGGLTRGFNEWDVKEWFGSPNTSDESSNNESNNVQESVSNSSSSVKVESSTIGNIDYSKCLEKYALDGSSGAELPTGYTNMWISYYIEVVGGKTIEFSSEPYKVCYYTSDLEFIRQDKFVTADTMTKTYVVPSTASYIRFQYCIDSTYAVPAVTYANRTSITISYVE